MGVRSALSGGLTRAAKAIGPGAAPAQELAQPGPQQMMAAAEDNSLMGSANQFSPGLPIQPSDGYSRTPRSWNYTTSYNVATRPRTHERVGFPTLKGLIGAYDVASACIWHRIDSIRSLDWKLICADGFTGDATDAIAQAKLVMKSPDHKASFKTWLAKYLYDVLAYDAGALYRMRNRAGRCVGLKPIDGSTIAPLLDYWGESPDAPAEAYVQYANGVAWNWLTRDDLIYEPFRPHTDSPYGSAPIESIIINANTDLRFQTYFLQRFTAGNVPEAFASAPENWDPTQVEQWQAHWDSMMYGDQAKKHQIQWLPGGSTFTWSNEKDFTDTFSLFLMRKTCSAFHVTPADLGFTEDVNRSSGESQADVQHRVGDLPLMEHVEGILTAFLQDDLGLPVEFEFDRGQEQDDQLDTAQADDIYAKIGVVGVSELREMRFGLTEPQGEPVPRFIFTERGGPIPLNSLDALAGKIDPQTGAPAPGAVLPHTAFPGAQGAMPMPPMRPTPLAVQEYGPAALPAAGPEQPGPVAKEAAAGPTVGITSETGITSYDLTGRDGEDEGEPVAGDGKHHFITEDEARAAYRASITKEMAAFRSFRQKRRRSGEWRDFEFRAVDAVSGHNLNDDGRLAVRKAAGEVAVAGLAVRAADTGRVLMLQRALDPADPAGGTYEFPGGHLDLGESPLAGAWREFAEETGCVPPPGVQTGTWTSANGIYQGIVWTAENEASVPVRGGSQIANPDDPDGDMAESIAWWSPDQLPGNPAVRPELLADIEAVMAALTPPCCGRDCCADGCCGGAAGCTCGPAEVAKASGGQSPKGGSKAAWPGWRLSDQAAAYWAPLVTAAAASTLSGPLLDRMAAAYLAANPGQDGTAPGKQARNDAAYEWLVAWLAATGVTLDFSVLATGILTDGYLIGAVSADAVSSGTGADLGVWQPGDAAAVRTRLTELGLGTALVLALTISAGVAAAAIAAGFLRALARVLAGADGGSDPASLAADLGSAVADPGSPAIDDTLTEAAASAAGDVYAGHDVVWGQWSIDYGTKTGPCPLCLANEAASPLPYGEPYPSGDVSGGPVHPHCVIGSTRVAVPESGFVVAADVADGLPLDPSLRVVIDGRNLGRAPASAVAVAERDFGRGNIRAVTVRDYVGDVITIRTALGHELTATPNHPVATGRGWIPVADLAVGDDVLSSTAFEWVTPTIDPDVDNIPPCIEDVAKSLPVVLGPVPTSAEDFHGDGSGSEVHVVRADGLLVDGGKAGHLEHSRERQLRHGGVPVRSPKALDTESLGGQELGRLGLPPDGSMGGLGLPGSLTGGHSGCSHEATSAPVARLDATLQQNPAERRPADSEGFCESVLALAGDVAPDEIVSVRRHPFSDHVYNLDTVEGWYISNGILTHNCNCAVIPAEAPEDR